MNFITIFHKSGELTVSVDQIGQIKKVNAHDMQSLGGEKEGEIIPVPDTFYAHIQTYKPFSGEKKYDLLSLTEEQYISLLEKIKNKQGEVE